MNDAPLTAAVSVSRPPVSETARHPAEYRDGREIEAETPCLKALARRILERVGARDTKRDTPPRPLPCDDRLIETPAPACLAPDEPDERAALVEYGAGVPRRWAEGFAALCNMAPPSGFSPERWQRIIDGAGKFLDRWAAKAAACGWSDLDVFGADVAAPDRRFDCMGLVLLLERNEIVSIDAEGADLRSPPDAMLRYRRRPLPAHSVSLWELARR